MDDECKRRLIIFRNNAIKRIEFIDRIFRACGESLDINAPLYPFGDSDVPAAEIENKLANDDLNPGNTGYTER
jgi:hypothetical protein